MINWTCKAFDEFTTREWHNITVIRQKVFIVEQYCPYSDIDNKDLKAYHLLGTNENEEIVAYSRLLPVGLSYENKASIGRILSTEKARGTGAGKELIKQSIEWVERLYGKVDIKIGAQYYLKGFYEKFGFRMVSDIYLEDCIPHIDMERVG
jgi:ElaA protein